MIGGDLALRKKVGQWAQRALRRQTSYMISERMGVKGK